jgi:hypothetical protein
MLDPRANYYKLVRGDDIVVSGSWGWEQLGDIEVYSEFNDNGVHVPTGKVLIRLFHRLLNDDLGGLDLRVGTATTTGLTEVSYSDLRRLDSEDVAAAGLPLNADYPVLEAVRVPPK